MATVEIDGTQIASWTPVIIRGGVFQIPIGFLDDGEPENVLSASVIITPNDGFPEEQWTQANGLFPNVGVGEFTTNLSESDTTGIAWDSGSYRIEIVDGSGFTVPCIVEGLIFAKDC